LVGHLSSLIKLDDKKELFEEQTNFYLFLQFICLALQGQLVCAGFGHSRHEQKTV
jgi:hypothetical protein